MPTPAAIATAEWFYGIRRRPTQLPAHVAENAKAEREYLLNLWAEEIDKRMRTAACDCGGFPHGKHCAAVMAGRVEHTPTTPNGD